MLIILAVVGLAIAGSILLLAREVRRRMGDIQVALDELTAVVAENTAVTQALVAQLELSADDPAEVRALAAKLKANTDALAAKVAPPPEPPVEPIP